MPYLDDSNEWRLLGELGRLLDQRKARHHVPAGHFRDHRQVNLNAELIETELRSVFTVKQISRVLDATEFERCQTHLSSLCSLLDGLARAPYIYADGLTYPRLRALPELLQTTHGEIDLASGRNQTLFDLPNGATALDECLRVITEYNKVIDKLLAPPLQEPVIPPLQKQQHKNGAWKEGIIRNQAILTLKALFKHFKCGTPHEVLLKLIEDPDEDLILPDLQLLLSPCLDLSPWQEARCDFANPRSSTLSTPDVCLKLRQHTGQGRALVLHIEDNNKFALSGTWSNSTYSETGSPTNESLDQLILKGAFRSFNPNISNEVLPARVSLKDRRELAVKLGFCLMNFFDADFASKRICFRDRLPYLAFASDIPVPTDLENFRMGHPALLSFAKLLLELDFGQNIEIDISPDFSGNEQAWCQLLGRIENLERERNDSYVAAIRGCFMAPFLIARALKSRRNKSKDADSIIRKHLYKEIVYKLKLGYDQSNFVSTRKRQRPDSPSRSGHRDGIQASKSTNLAMRSVEPEQTTPGYKKRRMPEPQAPSSLYGSIHTETSSLCNNKDSADGIANSYHRMGQSMRPSRRSDFDIAIICTLSLEYDAVSYIFDEFWDEDGDQYGRAAGDTNHYTTGRMGNYSVVLALLPQMGKAGAASAAASMRSSYTGVRLALLTGVCGSVPHVGQHEEIFLGDVIISKTVFQYDFGWQFSDGFVRKNTVEDNLGRANKDIRSLVTTFETDRGLDRLEKRTENFLKQLQGNAAQRRRQAKYDYPGTAEDKLFEPTHRHKHHKSPSCVCRHCVKGSDPVCEEALSSPCKDLGCDDGQRIARKRLHDLSGDTPQPAVHVGAVASGDKVMKSAAERDKLSREAGVIAFETDGAGIWDEVPCIVVKGVCDYADSHKHPRWQNFAAAAAAAASRAILESYIRTDAS